MRGLIRVKDGASAVSSGRETLPETLQEALGNTLVRAYSREGSDPAKVDKAFHNCHTLTHFELFRLIGGGTQRAARHRHRRCRQTHCPSLRRRQTVLRSLRACTEAGGRAMARLRAVAEQKWAQRLLEWQRLGPRLEAEISGAKYFVFESLYEVIAWAEVRDWGGRYRQDVGVFGNLPEAQQACELDAQRRLRREEDRGPVDVRIASGRRVRS